MQNCICDNLRCTAVVLCSRYYSKCLNISECCVAFYRMSWIRQKKMEIQGHFETSYFQYLFIFIWLLVLLFLFTSKPCILSFLLCLKTVWKEFSTTRVECKRKKLLVPGSIPDLNRIHF